jgi:hypothetical protein
MDQAKPWYLSKSVLAQLAAILLLAGTKFGLLPADMTNDQVVNFMLIAIPMAIALYGRLTAKQVLTASKGAAGAMNPAASSASAPIEMAIRNAIASLAPMIVDAANAQMQAHLTRNPVDAAAAAPPLVPGAPIAQ